MDNMTRRGRREKVIVAQLVRRMRLIARRLRLPAIVLHLALGFSIEYGWH